MDLQALLPHALRAAREACQVILDVYTSGDFQAEAKGDQSPVTRADKLAHAVIAEHLAPTGLFVLSEEGKEMPYDTRKDLPYFWMVDPLDGTKEFLKPLSTSNARCWAWWRCPFPVIYITPWRGTAHFASVPGRWSP
jgi:3'(2'), 5'-bisphosphate nucleotidase